MSLDLTEDSCLKIVLYLAVGTEFSGVIWQGKEEGKSLSIMKRFSFNSL